MLCAGIGTRLRHIQDGVHPRNVHVSRSCKLEGTNQRVLQLDLDTQQELYTHRRISVQDKLKYAATSVVWYLINISLDRSVEDFV